MNKNLTKLSIILLAIILILSFSPAISFAQILGNNVADDKVAHMFLAAWVTKLCGDMNLDWWQSGLIILGLSLAKESMDKKYTGSDMGDVAFSMAGWAISFPVDAAIAGIGNAVNSNVCQNDNIKKELISKNVKDDNLDNMKVADKFWYGI
jgi:hypothetical protein